MTSFILNITFDCADPWLGAARRPEGNEFDLEISVGELDAD